MISILFWFTLGFVGGLYYAVKWSDNDSVKWKAIQMTFSGKSDKERRNS